MDGDGRKVALAQQSVELVGTAHALDEDDDLVELERVEQVVQLAILLVLLEPHKVLLEAVKGQFGLVVDIDLKRVLHELLADRTDVLGEGGTEHHDLLAVRRRTEDVLDVAAHVHRLEQLVTLVQDKVLDAAGAQVLVADERVQTARRGDDDVRASRLLLEDIDVGLDGRAAVEGRGPDVWQVLAEPRVLVADLEGELARVTENDDGDLAINRLLELLQSGEDEDSGLAQTGLGLTKDVHTEDGLRDADLLDCNEPKRYV